MAFILLGAIIPIVLPLFMITKLIKFVGLHTGPGEDCQGTSDGAEGDVLYTNWKK